MTVMCRTMARSDLLVTALLVTSGLARGLAAQSLAPMSGDSGKASFHLWGSLSVGPAIQTPGEFTPGNLALWSTYRSIAVSVRYTDVSAFFEPGLHFAQSMRRRAVALAI